MRSPRSAPRENGLEGSTETTPTVRPSSRICPTSAPIKLDFPTPGGPVTPTTAALPVSEYTSRTSGKASGSRSSTSEIARASTRRLPARTPATNCSSVGSLRAPQSLCAALRRATRFRLAALLDLLEECGDAFEPALTPAVLAVPLAVPAAERSDGRLRARLDRIPLVVLGD